MNLFSLSGQTALVTGGTRGIGQAMAIGLAEAGADIILIQVGAPEYDQDIARCHLTWMGKT
jgi:2-deoxy-D-gluconate 3-dehydrogenase